MSITILGPGLVGSFLGAIAGAEAAITGPSGRIRALRARTPGGDYRWRPTLLTEVDPAAPTLVATRSPDTPWDSLGPTCLVAQNGLGQPRPTLACFLAVDLRADGSVGWTGPRPRICLEPPLPCWEPALRAWAEAGITIDVMDDAEPARWEKAILNATVGPLCLASGLGMAAVWADPELRALVLEATAEGDAIATAEGVTIPPGLLARCEAFFSQAGGHRPSLLDDPRELHWVLDVLLECAGRRGLTTLALAEIWRRCGGAVPARA